MLNKKFFSAILAIMLTLGNLTGYASGENSAIDEDTSTSASVNIQNSVQQTEPTPNDAENEENSDEETGNKTGEETTKPTPIKASGTLESGNVSWSLTSSGMLTISGTGKMDDFSITAEIPWKDYNEEIKFIYISDGITKICDYAFSGLTAVQSVYIAQSVTSVGAYAFDGCQGLKEINLPENLTEINDHAFNACSSLTEITIPENISTIGFSVFSNCSSLENIHVVEQSGAYYSVDGVLFNGSSLVSYPDAKTGTEYTIPEGILSIADFAFDNCTNLVNVILPDTLECINPYAFYECNSIEAINIPASVNYIDQTALVYGCSSLKEINVDEANSVYSSESGVLFDKDKTKIIRFPAMCEINAKQTYTLPITVQTIGQEAFMDCQTIDRLTIYGGLKTIESAAFMNANSITRIHFLGTSDNWDMVTKDVFNEKLNDTKISFMSADYEDEFPATVGVTYHLKDFVDISQYADVLETLVVSSSNPDVAAVDTSKMTAISEGEAIITAIAHKDGAVLAAAVKVNVTLDANASYNNTGFTLKVGERKDLNGAINIPEDYDCSITWTSSNNTVVTVSDDGYVTALNEGKANVMASVYANGKFIFNVRCEIEVLPRYTPESYFEFSNGVITKYVGGDPEVNIPPTIGGVTVTEIGKYAFGSCRHVTKVKLPETIIKLNYAAFYNCSSLVDINLHEGITYLGNSAFSGCTSLIEIAIPASVTNDGQYWFDGCKKLNTVTFAYGTTTINKGLRSSGVKNVILPQTLKNIEAYAFDGCTQLTKINVPSSVTSIGNYAFNRCYKLSNVTLNNGITTIGNYAFSNCTALTSITIPNSVTKLCYGVFSFCHNLKSASLGTGLTCIPDYAFSNTKLESITIPENVTEIGECAFNYCSNLKTVNLNSNLKTISSYAFNYCSSLSNILIPEGVSRIERSAFYGCSSLTSIAIPDTVTHLGSQVFRNCRNLKNVEIGKKVPAINQYTFSGCYALESIVIPDNITSIGSDAFAYCRGLKEITLGNGLVSLGQRAFMYASSLESIVIPNSVTSIGGSAFYGCSKLTDVTIGSGIKTITNALFEGCTSIKNIIITDGVTNIGYGAFRNCYTLQSVTIPDSVTSIGEDAFYNCKNLKYLTLGNGIKTIGSEAFSYCSSLENVTIPDSVTKLGNYAFYLCSNLRRVKLGSGLETIGLSSFGYCSMLSDIVIPDSVTYIYSYAFNRCSRLQSLTLGSGVKSIGVMAFAYCNSLTSVVFPENVSYLGNYAFACSKKLSSVQIDNPLCQFGYGVFTGCDLMQSECSGTYKVLSEEAVGYFPMQIEYNVTDNGLLSGDKKITVDLPEAARYVEGSMKLDGEAYNCTYEWRQYYYNRIIIPLDKNSGTLTFFIKPEEYKTMSTSATMSSTSYGSTMSYQLGQVNLSMPEITVSSVDITGKPEIIVEGTAIPRKNINLYIDDELYGSVKSNYTGNYATTLSIRNPENYHNYKITAEITDNDQTFTDTTYVQYVNDTPNLEELTFNYGVTGRAKTPHILYSSRNGVARPIILWGDYWTRRTDNYDYYFSVDISQRETVDKVYVVSTRNGKKEYLEAKWNSETQKYETSGYFTGSHSYMPGVLTVEYTKLNDGTMADFSDIGTYLGFEYDTFIPSVTDFTSSSYSAAVAVTNNLQEIFGNMILMDYETVDKDYSTVNLNDLLIEETDYHSYYIIKGENKYVVSFDLTNSSNMVIHIHDITSNKQTTYTMSFTSTDSEGAEINLAVTDILSQADEYAGKLLNVYNLSFDTESVKEGLMLAGLRSEKTEEALGKLEDLEFKKQIFVLTSTVLNASTLEGVSAPTDVLGFILDIIENDITYFKNLRLLNVFKIGSECRVRWKIDPSGYVYEGVTDNRLENVTATAYFIDTSNISSVDDIDFDNYKVWNAAEYDQDNPIITGTNGEYRWDVPEGYWKIKFHKDGYTDAESEWLPVPPAQTDINIGLVSHAVPKVEKVYLTNEYMVLTFDKYMKPDTLNVSIGDANYSMEYDTTKKDAAGNVFAKEFVFNFDKALPNGTNYDISVKDAKSYANIAMADYQTTAVTPGELLPTDLIIASVEENSNTISVKYSNYSSKAMSFNAICTIYNEQGEPVEILMQTANELQTGEDITKEFTFSNSWSSYKIVTLSTNGMFAPVINVYDSQDAQ